jgi:hypothetical protein
VFDNKLIILKKARTAWPLYAMLDEDLKLHDEKRKDTYDNKRDNTVG